MNGLGTASGSVRQGELLRNGASLLAPSYLDGMTDPRGSVPSGVPQIASHPDRRGWWRLTTSLLLPAERERVFEFFADAFQLEVITPPWLHFHVVTPRPIVMAPGLRIDYRLRIRGIPVRWQSCISVWEPSRQFVDEQVRGPYRAWHHRHTFEEVDGGTLVGDEVDYSVPGGALAHWLLVRGQLLEIFRYRRDKLVEIFGADSRAS